MTPRPPHIRATPNLVEVSRFIMDCHANRFPDSRAPWVPLPELKPLKAEPANDEPVKFEPLPADLIAETPAERRLFDPTRHNYHE